MILCTIMELQITRLHGQQIFLKKFTNYKLKILDHNFLDRKSGLMVKALALHSQAFKFDPSLGLKFYCIFFRVRGPFFTPTGGHGGLDAIYAIEINFR